jgi:hypothetical protein
MLKLKNNTSNRTTTFTFQLNVCTVGRASGLFPSKRTSVKSFVAVAAATTLLLVLLFAPIPQIVGAAEPPDAPLSSMNSRHELSSNRDDSGINRYDARQQQY